MILLEPYYSKKQNSVVACSAQVNLRMNVAELCLSKYTALTFETPEGTVVKLSSQVKLSSL